MCYAIPGKITNIDGNIVTVDYFGELKKAKNDFYKLAVGEYIYAQGGFVIQRISEKDAMPILGAWKELFSKLKETDKALSRQAKNIYSHTKDFGAGMYQNANYIRQKHLGNACCVHGIIEFSNYCQNDCLYCGIQNANKKLKRYRMSEKEIINACDNAVNKLGFKALVLQSGEDNWYTDGKLAGIISKVREKCACLLILSIGERDLKSYKKLYGLGARAVLLRFETSDERLYAKYRPGHNLNDRLSLIRELGKMGYLIMTGFLIGLPGQSDELIMKDVDLTASLGAEMFSFGPFIAHPDTTIVGAGLKPAPTSRLLELSLNTIAKARIKYPDAKILATTALEALEGENAVRQALLSGANSLMINLTPDKYQPLYDIYPRSSTSQVEIGKKIESVIALLRSLGRAPADLGL